MTKLRITTCRIFQTWATASFNQRYKPQPASPSLTKQNLAFSSLTQSLPVLAKGIFHQGLNEEEIKDYKQAAYEPAGDVTDKDDKASKVPQELWIR